MLLAELGFRSLDEAIGRADVLSARRDVSLGKVEEKLDLSFITNLPDVTHDRYGEGVCVGRGGVHHALRSGDNLVN